MQIYLKRLGSLMYIYLFLGRCKRVLVNNKFLFGGIYKCSIEYSKGGDC